MGRMLSIWQGILALVSMKTGLKSWHECFSPENRALLSMFLPFAGFLAGALAALAVVCVQALGLSSASVVVGLAVLAVLGGFAQWKSLWAERVTASGVLAAMLVLLFEVIAVAEISNAGGYSTVYLLLYLPVAQAVAMLSAASVLKPEEQPSSPFAAVKGWHMLAGAAIGLVVMLPVFNITALALILAAIFAGSVTALAAARLGKQETAVSLAAVLSDILYLLVLAALIARPVAYY